MGGAQKASDPPQTPGSAGRKGGAVRVALPFYTYPLARVREMIVPMADGLRSLPDHQLEHELGQLRAISEEPEFMPAEQLLFWLYRAEFARRIDPEQQFDVALDLALGRVERQTNDADRAFIAEVGRKLEAIGGRPAMVRAYERMMALARPKMVERRRHILSKRWAGIAT